MTSEQDTLRRLRDTVRALPEGLAINHPIRPPNRPTRVYGGVLEFRQQGITLKVRGSLRQHWFPHPVLRFDGRPTGRAAPDLGPCQLRIRETFTTCPAQITSVTLGTKPRVLGYVPGVIRLGPNRAVCQLRFSLSNFHNFIGMPIRFTRDDQVHRTSGRLEFTAEGWRILLDQSPNIGKLHELLNEQGGYGIGHSGAISRTSGARFHISEASDLWSTLHFFFSFMRGLWSGPIIATGVGRRSVLSTEWGSWRISDWQGVASWYPKNQPPAGLNSSFSGFRRL